MFGSEWPSLWSLCPGMGSGRHGDVAERFVLFSRSAGAAQIRIQHPGHHRAQCARGAAAVAAACKASGVKLLDTAIPETIVDSIKLGGMVMECSEAAALVGREYTKRKMPV